MRKTTKVGKNIVKILMVFFVAFAFSGCYTVVWMPNQNTSDYLEQNNNNYYPENYYGDYYYYYDSPWWYPIISQNSATNSSASDRSKGTEFIRNREGGRGSDTRGGNFSPPLSGGTGEILTPAPPAVSNSTPDNNGKVESSKSSGSGSDSSNRSNNNNNRPARNDNGRNSNGRN